MQLGEKMKKLNKFLYFINAVLISNFVYYIDFVIGSASAFAAATCGTKYTYLTTGQRGRVSNLSQCSSYCTQYWGATAVYGAYVGSDSSCTCRLSITMSTSATYTEEMINCGRRSVCSYQYRDGSYTGYLSRTLYSDVACYSDAPAGAGGYKVGQSCVCCPCGGTGAKGESCMGSQNSAGPYMVVQAEPGAYNVTGCYMVGVGGTDPTGLFEYTDTDRCYYKE